LPRRAFARDTVGCQPRRAFEELGELLSPSCLCASPRRRPGTAVRAATAASASARARGGATVSRARRRRRGPAAPPAATRAPGADAGAGLAKANASSMAIVSQPLPAHAPASRIRWDRVGRVAMLCALVVLALPCDQSAALARRRLPSQRPAPRAVGALQRQARELAAEQRLLEDPGTPQIEARRPRPRPPRRARDVVNGLRTTSARRCELPRRRARGGVAECSTTRACSGHEGERRLGSLTGTAATFDRVVEPCRRARAAGGSFTRSTRRLYGPLQP